MVKIRQTTQYPWDGKIVLNIQPETTQEFAIRLRIPGWAQEAPVPSDLYTFTDQAPDYQLTVNGKKQSAQLIDGYATLVRSWQAGDEISLTFPMPVRRIQANAHVQDDQGKLAIERGPIVYCLEGKDQADSTVFNKFIPDGTPIQATYDANLLNGVVKLTGTAYEVNAQGEPAEVPFVAIPYSVWNNRGADQMAVWIPASADKARPTLQPTIASRAQTWMIQAPIQKDAPQSAATFAYAWGVNDQWEPAGSSDTSKPYFYWWLKKGTRESIAYTFDQPYEVANVQVYWLDFDHYDGNFRVPASWKLYYKQDDTWQPVKALSPYTVQKDCYNSLDFEPVKTIGLKIEAQLQKDASGGVLEWKVK